MATDMNFREALIAAQHAEMSDDPTVFVVGEDIESGIYGAQGTEQFGPGRVRNTPISEAGFIGAAIGAALTGMRPIVDLGPAVFMYGAMDQLISQAAKNRYMFGGQASIPLVVRLAMYYGGSQAAHHSDRPYPMLMNVPGLKVVAPATPSDAYGLLRRSIQTDDPVMFFEDTTLWGLKGPVDEGAPLPELGVGTIHRHGTDVTVVGVASGVQHALRAATLLEAEGISAEVVDPRTLVPLDRDIIIESVRRTGRLVIADPANRTCGAAAEIAAIVAEDAFDALRAPIRRVTTPDVPIPFSPSMERGLYPNQERIAAAARSLLDPTPVGADHERGRA